LCARETTMMRRMIRLLTRTTLQSEHTNTHMHICTQAQEGGHGGGTCPLFLFQGAVVDSPGKYAGAIIGTFLLAMTMEVRVSASVCVWLCVCS
jgi:hypothetical protein